MLQLIRHPRPRNRLVEALVWLLGGLAFASILALCSQVADADPDEPPLVRYAGKMAERHGIDPVLLKSICYVESNWISRDGAAGEKGLCQIKPDTAKMVCPKCYPTKQALTTALVDPHINIEFAAMYLAWLQKRVGNDPMFLAAAYNGGQNGPVRYLMKVRAIMPAYAPRESYKQLASR